jgi:DMSO reductase family type II enzyme chaperone
MESARESLSELTGEAELGAAARCRAYELFLAALDYPDQEFCELLSKGGLANPLRECFESFGLGSSASDESWRALKQVQDAEELAIEYTRLFDTGASGPPCPLFGGLYGGDRMTVMEESLRFYNHFGLTLSEQQRELPDHIATQLEFLHYLCYREAETLQAGEDAGAYQRAQRDFISRRLGAWIPKLRERLDEQDARPFFRALFEHLDILLSSEGKRLSGELGHG